MHRILHQKYAIFGRENLDDSRCSGLSTKIWWEVGILFFRLQCCFIFKFISTTGTFSPLYCVKKMPDSTALVQTHHQADDVSEVQNSSWNYTQSHQYLITQYTLSAQSEKFQLHQSTTLNEQEISSKVDFGMHLTTTPITCGNLCRGKSRNQALIRIYIKNKTLKGSFDCFILNI